MHRGWRDQSSKEKIWTETSSMIRQGANLLEYDGMTGDFQESVEVLPLEADDGLEATLDTNGGEESASGPVREYVSCVEVGEDVV